MPLLERSVTLIAFGAMLLYFSLRAPNTFATWGNFRSVLDEAAPIVLLAVGLTVVLAVGEFDLSFPSALTLASAACVLMMTKYGLSTTVAVLVGLGTGVVAGIAAGMLVSLQRASSFIVTLALSFIWTGVADAITGGQTIIEGINNSFISITDKRAFGLTVAVYVALGFSVLTAAMMRYTVPGRYLQSIGSNAEASRLAGVGLSRMRISAFAVLGLAAACAAILLTSRQAQFTPRLGQGLFLQPYVAAFFGMSVLAARRFNVFGTVIGALFIGSLETGLVITGAADWVANVVEGSVLAIIVLAARRSTR
jgi:ribose/xylose/arabinose/galactoside ABC-type transport system permease subunit